MLNKIWKKIFKKLIKNIFFYYVETVEIEFHVLSFKLNITKNTYMQKNCQNTTQRKMKKEKYKKTLSWFCTTFSSAFGVAIGPCVSSREWPSIWLAPDTAAVWSLAWWSAARPAFRSRISASSAFRCAPTSRVLLRSWSLRLLKEYSV